jgi:hypothetical protein
VRVRTGVVAGPVVVPTGRRAGTIGRVIEIIGGGIAALGRGAGSIGLGT